MPRFAIIGTIEVSPGRADDLLPVLMAHRARCLDGEPGTLQFEILKPHGDETKFLLYEVYESEAAFERHWNGASMAIARGEAAGMVTNITGIRCDLQEPRRAISDEAAIGDDPESRGDPYIGSPE